MGRPSICFVAQNAYGALIGRDVGHAGGIERQQSMMARWFAQRGYSVSMITWDEGYEDGMVEEGVRLYKTCQRSSGFRGVRFIFPRWVSLVRALNKANADLYYYNCGDLGLGQIALWARNKNAKVVFSVASDPDCNPDLPVLNSLRERRLYRYGLHHADKIIVQTVKQKHMLMQGFSLESDVIKMPFEGFSSQQLSSSVINKNRVLWVGRISPEKRLDWLLDVAGKLPDIEFDVVGAPNSDSGYATNLIDRMGRMRNVSYHGRVAHHEVVEFYKESALLCCTSEFEGFPNTFLEAWSMGLPVVSSVDPDGLVSGRGLGLVGCSVDTIAEAIDKVLSNARAKECMEYAAKKYFNDNHLAENVMLKFEKKLVDVAGAD